MARTPANTRWGKDISVCTLGGTPYVGVLSGLSMSLSGDVQDARSTLDTWDLAALTGMGGTIDFTLLGDGTYPMLTDALTADGAITVVLEHQASGVHYAFDALLTSVTVEIGEGAVMEQCSAVISGAVTPTAGAAAAPTPRVAPTAVFGQDTITSLSIASAEYNDMATSATIRYTSATQQARAILDVWNVHALQSRRVEIEVRKLVETSLPFMAAAIAGTPVAVSIELDTLTLAGTAALSGASWNAPDGPQEESITLVGTGAWTFS